MTSSTTRTLPDYVVRPGDACHLQPYACRNTQLYGFFLQADAATIQARLVDPILNAPSGGAINYQVLTGLVQVTYAFAAQGSSTLPPDNGFGFVPENSWTIWVPLAVIKHELGIPFIERIVFYPAWICVDNSWSLAAGREVYGFPKGYGPLAIPKAGEDPAAFSASTLVLPAYAPGNEGAIAPLMTVTRTARGDEAAEIWTDIKQAIAEIAGLWSHGAGHWALPSLNLILDIAGLIRHEQVPGVFLKQFRDAADGHKACYQAIVEAASGVDKLHSGGLLTGTYQATLHNYASHPLADTLGVSSGPQPLLFPYWVNFDFTIGTGTTVWSSSNG